MKYYTYKLDLMILNVLAVVMIVFLTVVTYAITGSLSFITNLNVFSFIMVILCLFLHEILHGFGFLCFRKAKAKNIVFGMELEKGIFYCMCKEAISKANVLVALLVPFVLVGVITYILGIVFSNDLLIFLSIFNISGSVGDLLMFVDIWMMPDDVMYLDLDDTTSFTILSRDNLTKKKFFSIILSKHGKYNDNIKAKDYTKIKVSKASWYFLIFFIIILLVVVVKWLGN